MNELLDLIRTAPLSALRDATYLEHELLPALGLCPDSPALYPAHLHAHFGGLASWQYPVQFAPYLVDMSTRRIRRYLEIGTRHGGTFMITVEYLKRFNPIHMALAIDPYRSPLLAAYADMEALHRVRYVNVNSQSNEAYRAVQCYGPFDLAFIDGDHSLAGFMNDWVLARLNSRMVAYHDADNDGYDWIRQFRERRGHAGFTEFYPDVAGRHGGIGVDYDPL